MAMRRAREKDKRKNGRRETRMMRGNMAALREAGRWGNGLLLSNRRSVCEPGEGVINCMYQEADTGRVPIREGELKVKHGEEVTLASLNVRSLWKATFQKQLADCMCKKGIGVMSIQETQTAQTTQYVVDDYLFVMFGGQEQAKA